MSKQNGARPIRVGLIAYHDDARIGGSLRVTETLANFLPAEGIEPQVIFGYGTAGAATVRIKSDTHFIASRAAWDLSAWYRVRRLVKDLRLDVAHFVDPVLWAQAAIVGLPVRTVMHHHGRADHWNESKKVSARTMFARLRNDMHVTISEPNRQWNQTCWLSSLDRTFVVRNAVDTRSLAVLPERSAARRALNLPCDKIMIGMFCRANWDKGVQDMVSLLRFLPEHWHAAFAGDGPDRKRFEELANAEGVRERFHSVGLVDDVRYMLAAIDAKLHMAHYEPFGLSIAEAMAAGVPVFGLRGEGELFTDTVPLLTDDNFASVPRHGDVSRQEPATGEDLQGLARLLMSRLADEVGRRRQVDAARRWVELHFDGRRQAADQSELYRRLLGLPAQRQ